MRLDEFFAVDSLSEVELLALACGNLIEDAPPHFMRIPHPPMLMIDRVTEIKRNGTRGRICAERHVCLRDWFFRSPVHGDPPQPGCLGLDAIWQLLELYLGLRGSTPSKIALGCDQVKFHGQIWPSNRLVRYEVDISHYGKLPGQSSILVVGTGNIFADGEHVYTVENAKVLSFQGADPLSSSSLNFETKINDQDRAQA